MGPEGVPVKLNLNSTTQKVAVLTIQPYSLIYTEYPPAY